ncbi:HAD family hydrolase [Chloroflexota bacterium]
MSKNNTRAVIWDMDGVIADTAPSHLKAWQEVFVKRGVRFTEEDFKDSFGLRNDTIIRKVLGEGISQDEISSVADEKEENFRLRIRRGLEPLPGVIRLMRLLAEHDFMMALASSAPMENIRLLTGSLGIDNFFQCVISEKDVTEGKPSPQGFLLAANNLGVKPRNCIVIEDAVAGVIAAKKAGMQCLAVTNTHPKMRLTDADFIVDTLEAVTVNNLEGLLNRS